MKRMHANRLILAATASLVGASAFPQSADTRRDAEGPRFFESRVRPVLIERCVKCHGPTKQKGGLRVDSVRALLQGGDSGPAIVPGKADESLLVEAIRHEGLEMPPDAPLPASERDALIRWVELGAPRPAESAATTMPTRPRGAFSDEDRDWWAFRPVKDPSVPSIDDGGWSRNPIDRFVLQALRERKLEPAPEADRATLVRRLYLDVTGLPPSPAELDEALADGSPDAHERLVDRLLGSPHHGERWARHWLDLVRYADSDGYRIDGYRPDAWRYRDYVVRSLNADKPYDQFVREQIAGDELFPGDPEALTATGYLRHWIYEYNNRDVRGQWSVILNDITDTTADVFLGLGLQCARCHDHKFDPILQKDYYRLQAFLAAILPRDDLAAWRPGEEATHRARSDAWKSQCADLLDRIRELEEPFREKAATSAIEKFPDDVQEMIRKPLESRSPLERQIADLAYRQVDYEFERLETFMKGAEKDRYLALRKQLAAFDAARPIAPPRVLSVSDVGPHAPPVLIPKRSDTPIEPGFPTILQAEPAQIPPLPGSPASTGRRAALAQWLTRRDNPLSTRVIVNRLWQHHFGKGLASNPSDFGKLGEPPSHPELLDWLTARFLDSGWAFKPIHRLILTSATYRQSTRHPKSNIYRLVDPDNRFYWRAETRRLDAEQIRDAVLAVSGTLDRRAGGQGGLASEPRLSIYTRFLRNARDPFLDVFDLPLRFNSTASRDTTTTPVQSLLLINSQQVILLARTFADRLEAEAGAKSDEPGRVTLAYRHAFGRAPSRDELAAAMKFLNEQARAVDPVEAGSAEATFLYGKIPNRDGQAALFTPDGPQRVLAIANDARMPSADFTIEVFFVARSVHDSGAVRTLVAKWDGDTSHPGWSLGITGNGSRRKPRTIVLQLVGRDGVGKTVEAALFSDHDIQLDRPYYAAAVVSLAGENPGSVTFVVKDLSDEDEPLSRVQVAHAIRGGFDNDLPLTIGGREGKSQGFFDGLIDDVRLSSDKLAPSQLQFPGEGTTTRVVGHWRFDPEPGVYQDSSGNRLHIKAGPSQRTRIRPRHEAFVDFCHALLNSSEFLYVD